MNYFCPKLDFMPGSVRMIFELMSHVILGHIARFLDTIARKSLYRSLSHIEGKYRTDYILFL